MKKKLMISVALLAVLGAAVVAIFTSLIKMF